MKSHVRPLPKTMRVILFVGQQIGLQMQFRNLEERGRSLRMKFETRTKNTKLPTKCFSKNTIFFFGLACPRVENNEIHFSNMGSRWTTQRLPKFCFCWTKICLRRWLSLGVSNMSQGAFMLPRDATWEPCLTNGVLGRKTKENETKTNETKRNETKRKTKNAL